MSMPEKDPVFRHDVVEDMEFTIPIERHDEVTGWRERLDVMVSAIRRNKEGKLIGDVVIVDEFAMRCEADIVEIPEKLELHEGYEIIVEDDADTKHKPLISKKLAAVVGGATLATATGVGVAWWNHRRQK